jgi:hypothetical protein
MPRKGNANSALIVARLLDTEGFSAHVASEVKRYSLRNARPEQLRRYREVKAEFSGIMQRLTKQERLLVGAYIRILKGMSFDTGLKIGLTAHVVECQAEATT